MTSSVMSPFLSQTYPRVGNQDLEISRELLDPPQEYLNGLEAQSRKDTGTDLSVPSLTSRRIISLGFSIEFCPPLYK